MVGVSSYDETVPSMAGGKQVLTKVGKNRFPTSPHPSIQKVGSCLKRPMPQDTGGTNLFLLSMLVGHAGSMLEIAMKIVVAKPQTQEQLLLKWR